MCLSSANAEFVNGKFCLITQPHLALFRLNFRIGPSAISFLFNFSAIMNFYILSRAKMEARET